MLITIKSSSSVVCSSKLLSCWRIKLSWCENVTLPIIFISCWNCGMKISITWLVSSLIITHYIGSSKSLLLSLSHVLLLHCRLLNSLVISLGSKDIRVLIWLSCSSRLKWGMLELLGSSISCLVVIRLSTRWCWPLNTTLSSWVNSYSTLIIDWMIVSHQVTSTLMESISCLSHGEFCFICF